MLISAKEIIKQSVDVYKANFELFLRYMLVLFIPAGIVGITTSIFGSSLQAINFYGFSLATIIYFLIIIAGSIFSIWISLSFIRVLVKRLTNKETEPVRTELQKAVKLIVPAFIVSILTTLAIFVGFALFIIPGIIAAVWFAFAMYSVALEDSKGTEAMLHSKELVRGRWSAVLWRLLAPTVVFAVILIFLQWLVSWPFEMIMGLVNPTSSIALTLYVAFMSLVGVIVSLLVTPLNTLAPTILYLELKKTPVKMEHPEPHEDTPEEPPVM